MILLYTIMYTHVSIMVAECGHSVWVPVNWETKKKNEKKRKETERKKKRKENKEKSNEKKRKKNET